jgi:hypothetical protein
VAHTYTHTRTHTHTHTHTRTHAHTHTHSHTLSQKRPRAQWVIKPESPSIAYFRGMCGIQHSTSSTSCFNTTPYSGPSCIFASLGEFSNHTQPSFPGHAFRNCLYDRLDVSENQSRTRKIALVSFLSNWSKQHQQKSVIINDRWLQLRLLGYFLRTFAMLYSTATQVSDQ